MSQIADNIFKFLKEAFPFVIIKREYYVVYANQKLFVDFFIPAYLIAVEVHGRQHDEFVGHFHKDDRGWRLHQKRDRIKAEWADVNNITYVVIREQDKVMSKDDLLSLIRSAS